MKDFDKPYRKAIFDALNGNISVPVYDEVKKIGAADQTFVILGAQRSTRDPQADMMWARRCSIDLIITQKTAASTTKDVIDSISEEILEKLFPDYTSFGVTEPSGFQFTNWDFETGTTQPMALTSTESVIAKVLTISINIIQQL